MSSAVIHIDTFQLEPPVTPCNAGHYNCSFICHGQILIISFARNKKSQRKCSSLVSIAAIKTIRKKHLGEERVYLAHIAYHSPSLRGVKAGTGRKLIRKLETGTEAELVEESCLLACSTCSLVYPQDLLAPTMA